MWAVAIHMICSYTCEMNLVTEPVAPFGGCSWFRGLLLEMRTVAGDDKVMHVSMARVCALSIVVGLEVAVSNIEVFSAATGLQQRVRFVLLWSSRIFRTIVNNVSLNIMNVFLYYCLIIHYAKRTHRIILLSVFCVAVSYCIAICVLCGCIVLYCYLCSVWLYRIFSTLPHKLHDFRERNFECKIRAFIFHAFLVWIIFHSKNNSGTYYNKCTTKVFRWTDGQTDTINLLVAFRNFTKAPKNSRQR
jgi:hypothetical protein